MQEFSDICAEIKELVVKILDLQIDSVDEIQDEISFFEGGLGLDSIDLLELIVLVEKKYGLKIKNDEAGRLNLRNPLSLSQAVFQHISSNLS